MKIPISTGQENYEIIDSGSIITFKDEKVTFTLAPELIVSLIFMATSDPNDRKIDYEIIEGKLHIKMINFNNSLGSWNIEPLQVAQIDNKKIYVNFIAYALNETPGKLLHYTWYKREEVTNAR